jgi:ATP-binding cassette subfamily C (CFTR/MRP) protein 1
VISAGELINLMQVDATKIEMFIPQFHVLWDGALQIIGYMTILYTLIGWPCFAGMGIMLCAGPVQGVVMGKLFGLNHQLVKHTDARVESTNEGLQGIQCVKMYTWEESLAKAITKNREEELKVLKKVAYLRAFSRAYMGALPGIVAVGSFVVFALAKSNADISAATLFSALVAFDQLRFPLLFYPVSLAQLAQAKVSAARVELFLGLKEVSRDRSIGSGQYTRNEDARGEIVVEDATVYWDDPNEPIHDTKGEENTSLTMSSTFEDVSSAASSAEDPQVRYPKAALKKANFRVSHGELCAVVGRVASGKSTLCSAILNEALLESGNISLNGKVAYAAQSPWILNATLRDNIIFGLPMEQAKYDRVMKACQLEHDLAMLDDGDLTEIGERGINLSGGQKARVSIARAAYSDAETIILDDPLSALDPEVGKLLFEECILDLMEGKTRLFVTNQIQFLRFCDTVVALKSGEVVEHGTFTDLVANEKGEVKRLLAESSSGQQASQRKSKTSGKESESGDGAKAAPKEVADTKAKALTTKEEQMIGGVSPLVYKNYLKAGGGYLKFGFVYFGFVLSALNQVATTSWISYWTSDAKYDKHSQAFYLGFFFMLALTLGLVTFVRSFLLVRFGIDASETLHRNLLNSIMRAPQSFFDTTPLGRILSRFSKDVSLPLRRLGRI